MLRVSSWLFFVTLSAFGLGCQGETNPSGEDRNGGWPQTTNQYADTVVDAPGNTGEGFLDAHRAANGVFGEGDENGSTDVFSLGFQNDVNNYVVLSWGGREVKNGPGVDFKVFENPFKYPGGTFMDQTVVELSRDGILWVTYPHDYLGTDETLYLERPELWEGFAGCKTFWYNEESSAGGPFASGSGGDEFDLDKLDPRAPGAAQIILDGFLFIRLVSAGTVVNPDTNLPFAVDPLSDGPDIDGVYGRYVTEK